MTALNDPEIDRRRKEAITELADAFGIDADVICGWVGLRQRIRTMGPREFEDFARRHGLTVYQADGCDAAS